MTEDQSGAPKTIEKKKPRGFAEKLFAARKEKATFLTQKEEEIRQAIQKDEDKEGCYIKNAVENVLDGLSPDSLGPVGTIYRSAQDYMKEISKGTPGAHAKAEAQIRRLNESLGQKYEFSPRISVTMQETTQKDREKAITYKLEEDLGKAREVLISSRLKPYVEFRAEVEYHRDKLNKALKGHASRANIRRLSLKLEWVEDRLETLEEKVAARNVNLSDNLENARAGRKNYKGKIDYVNGETEIDKKWPRDASKASEKTTEIERKLEKLGVRHWMVSDAKKDKAVAKIYSVKRALQIAVHKLAFVAHSSDSDEVSKVYARTRDLELKLKESYLDAQIDLAGNVFKKAKLKIGKGLRMSGKKLGQSLSVAREKYTRAPAWVEKNIDERMTRGWKATVKSGKDLRRKTREERKFIEGSCEYEIIEARKKWIAYKHEAKIKRRIRIEQWLPKKRDDLRVISYRFGLAKAYPRLFQVADRSRKDRLKTQIVDSREQQHNKITEGVAEIDYNDYPTIARKLRRKLERYVGSLDKKKLDEFVSTPWVDINGFRGDLMALLGAVERVKKIGNKTALAVQPYMSLAAKLVDRSNTSAEKAIERSRLKVKTGKKTTKLLMTPIWEYLKTLDVPNKEVAHGIRELVASYREEVADESRDALALISEDIRKAAGDPDFYPLLRPLVEKIQPVDGEPAVASERRRSPLHSSTGEVHRDISESPAGMNLTDVPVSPGQDDKPDFPRQEERLHLLDDLFGDTDSTESGNLGEVVCERTGSIQDTPRSFKVRKRSDGGYWVHLYGGDGEEVGNPKRIANNKTELDAAGGYDSLLNTKFPGVDWENTERSTPDDGRIPEEANQVQDSEVSVKPAVETKPISETSPKRVDEDEGPHEGKQGDLWDELPDLLGDESDTDDKLARWLEKIKNELTEEDLSSDVPVPAETKEPKETLSSTAPEVAVSDSNKLSKETKDKLVGVYEKTGYELSEKGQERLFNFVEQIRHSRVVIRGSEETSRGFPIVLFMNKEAPFTLFPYDLNDEEGNFEVYLENAYEGQRLIDLADPGFAENDLWQLQDVIKEVPLPGRKKIDWKALSQPKPDSADHEI